MHDFHKPRNLGIRTCTHKSQINKSEMQSANRDNCCNVMTAYCNLTCNLNYFIKVDEKALCLNYASNRNIQPKREKAVFVTVAGS